MQSEKGAIFYLKKKKNEAAERFLLFMLWRRFLMFERVDKRFLISKAGGSHTRTHARTQTHTEGFDATHNSSEIRQSHIHVTLLEKMTSQNFPNSHLFIRTHVYLWLQRTFTVTSLSLYQLTLTVTTACLTFWGTAFVSMERLSQLFFPVIFVSLIYRRLSEFSLS